VERKGYSSSACNGEKYMTAITYKSLIKTPCCGIEAVAYASIPCDFTAFKYWTDGYDETYLPRDGGLRQCICGHCFLLRAVKQTSIIEKPEQCTWDDMRGSKNNWWNRFLRNWRNIFKSDKTTSYAATDTDQRRSLPILQGLKDEELVAVIESGVKDDELLKVLHRRYWQYLNHPLRERYRIFLDSDKNKAESDWDFTTLPDFLLNEKQIANMQQLVRLQEKSSKPDWLELAELYRELGDIKSARKALTNMPITSEKEQLHLVIEKLILLEVCSLVRFDYSLEDN
jgi:hypothetical protein